MNIKPLATSFSSSFMVFENSLENQYIYSIGECMKNKIVALCGVLLLFAACPIEFGTRNNTGTETEGEATITWVDSAIGDAIGTLLRKPADTILPSDLISITKLNLSNKNITKLDDLLHFPSLNHLVLSNNKNISELHPLTNLPALTTLDVSANQIGDLNLLNQLENQIALANLTNLRTLNLRDNQIINLIPLMTLTKLIDLNLSTNQIKNLHPLKNLTMLTNLDLTENPVSDWTPVAHVPTVAGRPAKIVWVEAPVEAAVRATIKRPTGVIIPNTVANITTLDLSSTGINNLADFLHLTGLTNLNLSNNTISDISVLADLTKLTTLDLNENVRITNWTPVSHVPTVAGRPPHITWVYSAFETAVREEITRQNGVILTSEVENIHTLNLSNESITNLDNIVHFTALTSLNLSNNSISDISALAALTNLVALDLMNNNIMDISALANLTKLTAVNLMNNYISDIDALGDLTNLATLDLRDNSNITNWLPVAHVPAVKGRQE